MSTLSLYPGVEITSTTRKKRSTLKASLDNFCTFRWAQYDAFDSFGAFIVSNKDGLSMYNGPSWKNEYQSVQFSDGSNNLNGVTFSSQSIVFTVGVYWISIEDYNRLLNWLHPYEINDLVFGFNPNWHFLAKLNGITTSTRYVVGNESVSNSAAKSYTKALGGASEKDYDYRYYTEIKLSFDIQGQQCALGIPYALTDNNPQETASGYELTIDSEHDYQESFLSTPFLLNWVTNIGQTPNDNVILTLTAMITDPEDATKFYTKTLFRLVLKNLNNNSVYLQYDSKNGVLFYHFDDGSNKILTFLSTATTGNRIVDAMEVNPFLLPGSYDTNGQDLLKNNFKLILSESNASCYNFELVSCYPRRNTL